MPVHAIARGLDLPLAGEPDQAIEPGPAIRHVAILGADFPGMRAGLLVQPGDSVRRGQALVQDKKRPGINHCASAAGRVAAIHRGERRAFVSLVIEVADGDGPGQQAAFDSWKGTAPVDGEGLRALLVESGLWSAFRQRPFGFVPPPQSTPDAIFVTAMDTRPHAPRAEVVMAGREADFAAGTRLLLLLTPGPVFACKAAGAAIAVPSDVRIRVEEFSGPHPAGNAGTHIHFLHPVGAHRTVWHVGLQDVCAIGHLALTGKLDVERVVSLAGPGILRPRLVRTRLGASTDELTHGELHAGEQRVVSGSVLDGRSACGSECGYLGRYHQQVSALPEGRERELFGWITPGADKFSVAGVVLGAFQRNRKRSFTTTTNGSPRAMVPMGTYEQVMPLDILPTFLLRALLTRDLERAEALGALELDEDDLALCTYTCPGKHDYAPLLREALASLEKEG